MAKSKAKPEPRFKAGDHVTTTLVEFPFLVVTGSKWNGLTFMYSFEYMDMRCGEDYLKPYTENKL